MPRRPRLEVLEDRLTPVALVGLGTGASANTLFRFDSDDPATVTATIPVTGLGAGDTLVGIDYRPSDNRLYGVAANGNSVITVRIDPASGAADRRGNVAVAVSGATAYGVDINPITDEIRVVNNLASDGNGGKVNNFRLDPDTGALVSADPDLNFDSLFFGSSNAPEVAIAHDNSIPNVASTKLFGIVSGSDTLVYNFGSPTALQTLFFVGPLGVDTGVNAGMDIAGVSNTAFAVLAGTGKSSLYSVNLSNGAVSLFGAVGAPVALADVAIDTTPPTVTVSVDPALVAEGGTATVTVTLSGSSLEDVAVGLAFSGTASKADYTASGTAITVPAGETSASITITAESDGVSEVDEALVVDIATVTRGTEDGVQQATLTVSDTGVRPRVTLRADAETVAERNGSATVTVALSGASGSVVTVPLSFAGDATLDTDYSASVRQVVFLAGQTTQSFTVASLDDALDEPNEAIVIGLGAVVNADVGSPAELTLRVTDNDGLSPPPPPGSPPPPLATGVLVAVGADAGTDSRVVLAAAADGTAAFTFNPFDTAVETGFGGGARVAVADVTGDGTPDLIVGSGPGRSTQVRVYDGRTQGLVSGLGAAFEPSFTGGAFVAAGDVNGDGRADVVVTPDRGGGPRVRVMDGATGQVLADFFGIDDLAFRGGARAAVGDVNGDGRADLIVTAGFGGGPRVAVYDGSRLAAGGGPKLFGDFFVFEPTLRNGVYVAAGDLTGDGKAEVVVGGGPGGGPRVLALSGAELTAGLGAAAVPEANFFAGDPAGRGGVRVAVRDLNADGVVDLITGSGAGAGSKVAVYSGSSVPDEGPPEPLSEFVAFEDFGGGVFVG